MTAPVVTGTEDRALSLLGSGVSAEAVATALGVSPARISQLLANPIFADQVTALRYENLQKHNVRDNKYDTLEDKLLTRLEGKLDLLFKPRDILNAIQVVNNAKRRGQSAPEQITDQQTIVTLLIPTQIKQKFVTNITNQVVKAGDQSLVTMQSGNLLDITKQKEDPQEETHELKTDTTKVLKHHDL